MKRILIGVVVVVLLAIAAATLCHPSPSQLRGAADSLAGTYVRDTASYASDTSHTNIVLNADSAKPATRAAVKQERASAVRVIRTAEKQKENYRKQIKALTPTLRLFAELDYGVPTQDPLLQGTLSARAGVALKLKQDFDAQVFIQKPLWGKDGDQTLNVGLRKNWRLF